MENKQDRTFLLIEDQPKQPSPICAMLDQVASGIFQVAQSSLSAMPRGIWRATR